MEFGRAFWRSVAAAARWQAAERYVPVLLALSLSTAAHGQARANEPGGELPLPRGLNSSLTATVQHDSANGWTSLLLPDISWRWSGSLSLDVSLPVFTSITTEVNTGTRRRPVYELETKHHAVGDLQANAVYEHRGGAWESTTMASLGLPTGKTSYGLGAGKVTYALSHRVGYSFEQVAPDVELGIGNSSNVLGNGPTLPYVANATLPTFRWVPRRNCRPASTFARRCSRCCH